MNDRSSVCVDLDRLLRLIVTEQDKGHAVAEQLTKEVGLSLTACLMAQAHRMRALMLHMGFDVHKPVEVTRPDDSSVEVRFPDREVRGPG